MSTYQPIPVSSHPHPTPPAAPFASWWGPLVIGASACLLLSRILSTALLAAASSAGMSPRTEVAIALSGLLENLAYLVAWVVTGTWLTLARIRLDQRGGRPASTAHIVWAWLGWVVPVAHLFMPYQVVSRLLKDSGRRTRSLAPWWAIWTLGVTVVPLVAAVTVMTRGGDEVAGALVVSAALTVGLLVAFVPWVLVVRAVGRGLAQAPVQG